MDLIQISYIIHEAIKLGVVTGVLVAVVALLL
jgi:hypothetical protein